MTANGVGDRTQSSRTGKGVLVQQPLQVVDLHRRQKLEDPGYDVGPCLGSGFLDAVNPAKILDVRVCWQEGPFPEPLRQREHRDPTLGGDIHPRDVFHSRNFRRLAFDFALRSALLERFPGLDHHSLPGRRNGLHLSIDPVDPIAVDKKTEIVLEVGILHRFPSKPR